MNAIMNKNSAGVEGCTIYVALFPCNECAKIIIQSQIKEVVYYSNKHEHKPSTIASKQLLDMAGISYRYGTSTDTKHTSSTNTVIDISDNTSYQEFTSILMKFLRIKN